jgi:hypothetical protein
MVGGWGVFIYNTYNFSLATSVDRTMHPYLEWTYEAYALVAPNAFFMFFWLINYLFDHDAGKIDRFVLFLTKIMTLAPFGYLAGAFVASGAYGSEA